MNYEQFVILFEDWLGFQRAVHTLSPAHPMKKYYKTLLDEVKELPIAKQEEYFNKYYKKKD